MVLFQFYTKVSLIKKKQDLAPFNIFSSAVLHIMQQELRSLKK